MKPRYFTLPNILTLSNLACGLAAAVLAAGGAPLHTCFWLLAAAAFFDFTDGAAARLLGQYSPLGVQLDSLADMVSFGAAPSAIMMAVYDASPAALRCPDAAVWGMAAIALLSALRLARFNIDEQQHTEFIGLPTPACAMLCAGIGYAHWSGMLCMPREALLATALCCAALLIAPVRFFSLKFRNLSWRDNSLRYCFLILSAAAVLTAGPAGVSAAVILYILISCARAAAGRLRS